MGIEVRLDGVYVKSKDVVARKIEAGFIIVPLTDGVGDMEDELYSLNETGLDIWNRLDGKTPLQRVIESLCDEYEGDAASIRDDVVELVRELLTRRILVAGEDA